VFSLALEVLSVVDRGVSFLLPVIFLDAVAFIYWIVYWVQLNRYARELKSGAYRPPPADEGW
jgi:hypothetical protein